MRWMALLALLLLAGCTDPGPAPPAAIATPDEPGRVSRNADADGDGVRAYDAPFDLVLNPDNELFVVAIAGGNSNCVLFWDTDGPDYRVLGGTATMTWDALTPLAEELVLSVGGTTEPRVVSGPSPLTLDLAGLELHPDGWGVDFMADHDVSHLPVQQPATLQLTFDYEGDLPAAGQGICTNGLT